VTARRWLLALRLSFCAFIAWASGEALLAAWRGSGEAHLGRHGQLVLAGVELVAAVALLAPRLAKAASIVLLAVFAFAAVVTVAGGEPPLRFLYYAATAALLGFGGRTTGQAAQAA
jgi:hypothetical protein